jgi:predicted secreted protein
MGPVSGIVLYVVIWAMVFFVALPIRVQTQGDLKDVVPGTHAGAPEHHHLKKKALWTTLVAAVIWGVSAYFILNEVITVDDIERWLSPTETPIGGTDG